MAESKRLSVPSNPARMLRELAREQQPTSEEQSSPPAGEAAPLELTNLQERKKASSIVRQEASKAENNQDNNKDSKIESQEERNAPAFLTSSLTSSVGRSVENQVTGERTGEAVSSPAVAEATQIPTAAPKEAATGDRAVRLARILEAAEQDEMIVVSVRVPRRLNDYLDQYVSRAPRKASKQRYLKQDAMTEALAAFAVDHPMPTPEDLF